MVLTVVECFSWYSTYLSHSSNGYRRPRRSGSTSKTWSDRFTICSSGLKSTKLNTVDQVRRDEIREKGKDHTDSVTHTRFIWLKNPLNLTDKQKCRISILEKLNLKINRVHLLKEYFQHVRSYKTIGWAARFLKNWYLWATQSRLKPLCDFAWMLRRHEQGLLNYFKLRIDKGMVDGLDNKVKVVSLRAYGYRSSHMYITAFYHCLGNLQMPKRLHRFV